MRLQWNPSEQDTTAIPKTMFMYFYTPTMEPFLKGHLENKDALIKTTL